MTVNSDNARVFGSESDSISLAPLGTQLPESIDDALDPAFEDVGWIHADGIGEALSGSKAEIRGHQGGRTVRTRIETPGTSLGFIALESKPQTQSLRYDEKDVSVDAGVRRSTRSPGQKVTPRAAVIDLYDVDDVTVKERRVIERLEIVADGDRTFVGTDIAGFPFRGEIIGNYLVFQSAAANSTSTSWQILFDGTPDGGTWTLSINGFSTPPLAHNAAAGTVSSAINALSGVTGVSGVTASNAGGTLTLTFPTPVEVTAAGDALTGTDVDVLAVPA